MIRRAFGALALVLATPALGQTAPVVDANAIPGNGAAIAVTSSLTSRTVKVPAQVNLCLTGAAYTVCGAGDDGTTQRESFKLANANAPASPATVYGGDYILSQTCSSYGTLALQVLGPDGTTYLTILSKTASDSGSGAGLALGARAVVRVMVTGTAGCNAVLARVPS